MHSNTNSVPVYFPFYCFLCYQCIVAYTKCHRISIIMAFLWIVQIICVVFQQHNIIIVNSILITVPSPVWIIYDMSNCMPLFSSLNGGNRFFDDSNQLLLLFRCEDAFSNNIHNKGIRSMCWCYTRYKSNEKYFSIGSINCVNVTSFMLLYGIPSVTQKSIYVHFNCLQHIHSKANQRECNETNGKFINCNIKKQVSESFKLNVFENSVKSICWLTSKWSCWQKHHEKCITS